MFIQTESTPNPATLKFLPGQAVLEAGTADFPSPDTAGSSPLAARIFAVTGVVAVFFGNDFVTVTKAENVEWEHIKPAILGAVMEHYQSGDPVMQGDQGRQVTRNIPEKTRKLSIRSKSCWTVGCAPQWRRTAATSPFTGLSGGWFTCICRGLVPDARPRR